MDRESASPLEPELTGTLTINGTGQRVPMPFSPAHLVQEQIVGLRLAASTMSGPQRRDFMAAMSLKYCGGNPRLTESVFGWSRDAVTAGLGEKRTGIECIGLQSAVCGNKPWEEKHPEMAAFLCGIAEGQSPQDPTFQSAMAFTRLTAQSALDALKEAGFGDGDLPSPSSMSMILNRLGYRLRKVVKAKPLKTVKATDAIFETVKTRPGSQRLG